MFGFIDMLGTLEERKVAFHESGDGEYITLNISTAAVTDAEMPFETAVSHRDYNNAKWVIVATYPDEGQAALWHEMWVKKMTAKVLPKCLIDVGRSDISKRRDEVEGNTDWRSHPVTTTTHTKGEQE